MVDLDCSVVFDRVNDRALLYNLRLLGVDGSFINIFIDSYRTELQKACFDRQYYGARNVLSGVP